MMYDMFLELAKSEQRPLREYFLHGRGHIWHATMTYCAHLSSFFLSLELEIRRIETKSAKPVAAVKKSAEADHRRQAVIAAAEAREKAHKAKTKPIKTVTKTTLAREKQLQQEAAAAANSTTSQQIEPQSEEAKRAAAAAKQSEAQLAQQLGYNPYEPSRATAGQARNATTAVTHGSISAAGGADNSLPAVAPPRDVMESTGGEHELPIEVEEAFATMLSANAVDKVQSTCGIMKTLLLNATTKGQAPGEDSAKFRKVRLANAKIKAALVDVEGAMEIMMATGFILQEQVGESVLIFPADFAGPDWLPAALRQLESNSAGK